MHRDWFARNGTIDDGLMIPASDEAKRVTIPYQQIVANRQKPINPAKELMDLSMGNSY